MLKNINHRLSGIVILLFFSIVVTMKYEFLWPVLLFITISHLPVKRAKK